MYIFKQIKFTELPATEIKNNVFWEGGIYSYKEFFIVNTVQSPSYVPILALSFSWSSHLKDSKWEISPTVFGRWRPKKHI